MTQSELRQSPLFAYALVYSVIAAINLVLTMITVSLIVSVGSSFGGGVSFKDALVLNLYWIFGVAGMVGAYGLWRFADWSRITLTGFHVAYVGLAAFGLIGERLSAGKALGFVITVCLGSAVLYILSRPAFKALMQKTDLATSKEMLAGGFDH